MTTTILRGLGALSLLTAGLLAQTPCGTFEVLEVPFDPGWNRALFEDVDVLDDGSAWAVGYAVLSGSPGGPEAVTLAMHYDGSSWEHTPTPYVAAYPGGSNDFLHAVTALAPDDVWAAGERHGDAGGLSVGAWIHVIHWDGSSWSEVPVPEPPGGAGINFAGTRVYDAVALAEDDVWFSGAWAEPNHLASVTWRPLALHWDGSSLEVYDTPKVVTGTVTTNMYQLAALAPDDIWGILQGNNAAGLTIDPKLLHYDGSDWSEVSPPSLGQSVVLEDLVALASDDVWVFGHTYHPSSPFALHYDGSGWSTHVEVPFVASAAALAPDAIYTASGDVSLFDGVDHTLVAELASVDGPSILGTAAGDGCSLWAVGRRAGPPGEDLRPLAVRMVPGSPAGPWQDLGQGLTGLAGMPGLSGLGELVPGNTLSLTLSGAAPGAPTWLVLGGAEQSLPFKGGVLVPSPDVVLPAPPVAAGGGWAQSAMWPAGVPAGVSLVAQVWIADGSHVAGYAASNGLVAVTP